MHAYFSVAKRLMRILRQRNGAAARGCVLHRCETSQKSLPLRARVLENYDDANATSVSRIEPSDAVSERRPVLPSVLLRASYRRARQPQRTRVVGLSASIERVRNSRRPLGSPRVEPSLRQTPLQARNRSTTALRCCRARGCVRRAEPLPATALRLRSRCEPGALRARHLDASERAKRCRLRSLSKRESRRRSRTL